MEDVLALAGVALVAVALVAIAWWLVRRHHASARRAALLGELRNALRAAGDVVPELLDAASAYAPYERAVLDAAQVAARRAREAQHPDEVVAVHDELLTATGDVRAILEVYSQATAHPSTARALDELERALSDAATCRAQWERDVAHTRGDATLER